MDYPESKIYSDGSHYIAIPHKGRAKRQAVPSATEQIAESQTELTTEKNSVPNSTKNAENADMGAEKPQETERKPKYTTKKDIFNALYDDSRLMTKGDRRQYMRDNLLPFFEDEETCSEFIANNFARKKRNAIVRRIRLNRKLYLQEWNYFCTFTYDDKLQTEQTFKQKLRMCLAHLRMRRDWKYIGVWERSPEKQRLHFHGIFYIPTGAMVGELVEKEDYSFNTHKRQKTVQNTYFNARFGRSDFEEIADRKMLQSAVAYIVKYMEKTGEKLVYSKNLPQFFISDIWKDDIVCKIGLEDSKLLLYDDFVCRTDGKRIGKVSRETIAKMPKSNK